MPWVLSWNDYELPAMNCEWFLITPPGTKKFACQRGFFIDN
jgi:hypothetical protein